MSSFDTYNAFIDKKLNVKKIREGENNSHYYHKMHEWFLNDIETICGGKRSFECGYDFIDGVETDVYVIRFHLFGERFVRWVSIVFNWDTGEFIRVEMVKARMKKSYITPKQRYIQTVQETNLILKHFFDTAKELGYLL